MRKAGYLAVGSIVLLMLAALPIEAQAKGKGQDQWVYNGRVYDNHGQCMKAKNEDKKKGAIVGAVGGAATVAILGGNLGEAALGAGVGAGAGAIIGKNAKKC